MSFPGRFILNTGEKQSEGTGKILTLTEKPEEASKNEMGRRENESELLSGLCLRVGEGTTPNA